MANMDPRNRNIVPTNTHWLVCVVYQFIESDVFPPSTSSSLITVRYFCYLLYNVVNFVHWNKDMVLNKPNRHDYYLNMLFTLTVNTQ